MFLYLKYLLLSISVLSSGFNSGLSQTMPESKPENPREIPQEIEFANTTLTDLTPSLSSQHSSFVNVTAVEELKEAITKKDRKKFFFAYDKLNLPMLDHAEKEMIYRELYHKDTLEEIKQAVEDVLVDSLGDHSKEANFTNFNATYEKAHDFLHLPALDDDSRMDIQARLNQTNEISLGHIQKSIEDFAVDKTNKALVMNGSSSDEMFKAAYELLEELLELPELEPVHMQMVKSDLKSKDARQDIDHITDAVEDFLIGELLNASKSPNDAFITAYTEYQDFLGLPYVNENSTKMMIKDTIRPIKKATIGAMKRRIKGFAVEKMNEGLTMDDTAGNEKFEMAYKLLHLPDPDKYKDTIKTKLKALGNTTVDMDDINKVVRDHVLNQVKTKGMVNDDMIIWYTMLDLPKIDYVSEKGHFWQNAVKSGDYTLPGLKAVVKAVVKTYLKAKIENMNNHINNENGFIETYRTLGLPNLKNKDVLKVQSKLQNLSRNITMEDVQHYVKDQLMTQINRAMERDDDEKFKWAFTNLPLFDEQVVKESEALMAKHNLHITGLNMFDYEDIENAARLQMDKLITHINGILAEEDNATMTQRFIKAYRFLKLPKIKEAIKPKVKADLWALKRKTKRDVIYGDVVRAVEDGLIGDLIVALKNEGDEFISTYKLLTELPDRLFLTREDANILDIKAELSQMNNTVLSGDVKNIARAAFIEDLNIAMKDQETDRFVMLYRMLSLQTEEVEILNIKSYFSEGHSSFDDFKDYYKDQLIKEMKQAVRNYDEEKFRQVYRHKLLGLPVIQDVELKNVLAELDSHGEEFVSITNLQSLAHRLLQATLVKKIEHINYILNNPPSSDSDFIEAWHGLGLPNLEDRYIMNMKSMLISANAPMPVTNVTNVAPPVVAITMEHFAAVFEDQLIENMKKASAENHHALFVEKYRLLKPEMANSPAHTILHPESRLETMSESAFENGTSLTSALQKLNGVTEIKIEEEEQQQQQKKEEEQRKKNATPVLTNKPKNLIFPKIVPDLKKQPEKKLTPVMKQTQRTKPRPKTLPTPGNTPGITIKTTQIPDHQDAPAADHSATIAHLAPRPLTLVLSCVLVTLIVGLCG